MKKWKSNAYNIYKKLFNPISNQESMKYTKWDTILYLPDCQKYYNLILPNAVEYVRQP